MATRPNLEGDSPFTMFVALLVWAGLMAFAIWLIGWSVNLWWLLGWG